MNLKSEKEKETRGGEKERQRAEFIWKPFCWNDRWSSKQTTTFFSARKMNCEGKEEGEALKARTIFGRGPTHFSRRSKKKIASEERWERGSGGGDEILAQLQNKMSLPCESERPNVPSGVCSHKATLCNHLPLPSLWFASPKPTLISLHYCKLHCFAFLLINIICK